MSGYRLGGDNGFPFSHFELTGMEMTEYDKVDGGQRFDRKRRLGDASACYARSQMYVASGLRKARAG
jgi:hypothetical protein